MNKRSLYTALGIIAAVGIAVGGWFLTSALIDARSEALLSSSGITALHTLEITPLPTPTPTTTPDTSEAGLVLPGQPPGEMTEEEPIPISDGSNRNLVLDEHTILSILRNRQFGGEASVHDPIAGQIDKEEAIKIANKGLSFFYNNGIIENDLSDSAYEVESCFLYQHLPYSEDELLTPAYSFWHVLFVGRNFMADINVNAVTGQIWDISISANNCELNRKPADIEQALTSFLHSHGLRETSDMVIEQSSGRYVEQAVVEFADGLGIVLLTVNEHYREMDDRRENIVYLGIFMTYNGPHDIEIMIR